MRTREAEIAQLEAEILELDGPLGDRLAVIPSWVRAQVRDVAGLLSDAPERAKSEFQRLGVGFTLSPVRDEGRPFLRAEGQTDLSVVMAGQDFTPTYRMDLK